jgi:hypothetical protein
MPSSSHPCRNRKLKLAVNGAISQDILELDEAAAPREGEGFWAVVGLLVEDSWLRCA